MTTPWFQASSLSIALFSAVFLASFAALGLVLRKVGSLAFSEVVRLFIVIGAFSSLALGLAKAELLLSFSLPPRPFLLAWAGFALLLFALRFGKIGEAVERVPLGYLVLLQAFRLPLELVMHHLAGEKVMPVAMSFSGRNFDIVTGVAAVVVGGGLLRFGFPRWTAWVFGALGTGLLVNVLFVAVSSMPGSTRAFGDDVPNVWVSYPPFVLLPELLVPLAMWLHYRAFVVLLDDVLPRELDT